MNKVKINECTLLITKVKENIVFVIIHLQYIHEFKTKPKKTPEVIL